MWIHAFLVSTCDLVNITNASGFGISTRMNNFELLSLTSPAHQTLIYLVFPSGNTWVLTRLDIA